jgi:hypothetical protein
VIVDSAMEGSAPEPTHKTGTGRCPKSTGVISDDRAPSFAGWDTGIERPRLGFVQLSCSASPTMMPSGPRT